jgi:hypothetical protein
MQTRDTIQKLINQMSFNDWRFHYDFKDDVPYIQIKFLAPRNMTGRMEIQSCRKWMLSYHMCDEEIVSTGLKAVLAAVEHEAREQFKWKGQPIYRPHYNLDALYDISKKNAVEKRKEKNDEQ